MLASAAFQSVRHCRCSGVAGGEQVPSAMLGWYFQKEKKMIGEIATLIL